MKIKLHTTEPEAFAKRAFFLAYEACGGPLGMGAFQARSSVTEDDVFKNVCVAGGAKNLDFYGDYVFGRMMKFGIQIKDSVLNIKDNWRPDYQSFCIEYKQPTDLIKATLLSLGEKEDAFDEVK